MAVAVGVVIVVSVIIVVAKFIPIIIVVPKVIVPVLASTHVSTHRHHAAHSHSHITTHHASAHAHSHVTTHHAHATTHVPPHHAHGASHAHVTHGHPTTSTLLHHSTHVVSVVEVALGSAPTPEGATTTAASTAPPFAPVELGRRVSPTLIITISLTLSAHIVGGLWSLVSCVVYMHRSFRPLKGMDLVKTLYGSGGHLDGRISDECDPFEDVGLGVHKKLSILHLPKLLHLGT
mmetsp:Transcript_29088/g.55882  ORF Transcript_29088/g.55882 Transcript_29088/m.55882 type:complete len:234 (-) Transcript_29088:578-1279(-)